MSELQDMLRVQARLHRKQGANALGDLFQSAALEIEILTERLEKPQGLQELICVEQMKEISLPEIHRANQKLHEQLAKANERVKESNKALAGMFWYFNPDGSKYPLAEKALNKFAIEKQLETAKKCAFGSTGWVLEHIKFLEEQLRKEQEHV